MKFFELRKFRCAVSFWRNPLLILALALSLLPMDSFALSGVFAAPCQQNPSFNGMNTVSYVNFVNANTELGVVNFYEDGNCTIFKKQILVVFNYSVSASPGGGNTKRIKEIVTSAAIGYPYPGTAVIKEYRSVAGTEFSYLLNNPFTNATTYYNIFRLSPNGKTLVFGQENAYFFPDLSLGYSLDNQHSTYTRVQ